MKELKKIIFVLWGLFTALPAGSQTLAEQLGYKKTDRILIINNDDAGMCHAANLGTIQAMTKGIIRSATIMPPCPWFNEIADFARTHPEYGFGVHLTLTSEWKHYRWASIAPRSEVPGLYDKEGYLWKDASEVYAASNIREALIEGRAQIKKALDSGIPVTHIDSHMGTFQYDSSYMKMYLQLAKEFDLPLRMAAQTTLDAMGFSEFRKRCRDSGLVTPDYFVYEEFKDYKTENVETF
ncbi:polysaccharide deacetylase family protein [Niabella drilacis]|uniref:YdjC-like protein n=1 Tax=Niabella drilacis (strain DSM 25811 / CCM 8410 / CCUG 62505 / LMG 26954 / E90) TaxID=1285928 RepID=A0A1G6M4J0_NIADE|nr:polysaccharide deacetylase family protein [Niabella drilacis]SDC50462.1 hypothetical protein SAMN04487894_102554 [Niabella drilacis]